MTESLETICSYRNEKASAASITAEDLYVSTESMGPNRGGVSKTASVPSEGKVSCFRKGDTLVSNIRPYFKKIWKADIDGYCSNDVLVFQPSQRCSADYLYWLLCDDAFFDYVMATSKGTKMPRGDKSAIMSYAIPSNSEMAQRNIASILAPIQAKIEMNAKLNGYLEELARAMYVNAMQEHADSAALRDLAEFNPETYSPKENWSAVSYIDTSALMLNDLAGLQHFNLAEEKLPARARRKVSDGDILYSTVRPNQNHYGLLYGPVPHMLASTAFAVIRPNDTIMSPLVYLALTDARITKTLQQLAETSTSTIPSIRPVDLEQIAVLVPSDECGNEIAAQIGTAFKQIDCNKRENRKLAALRDALLPKLMSGEIDVSKVDLTQLNSHLSDC
ncbi:restriction endonuclease subunit S [Senegalimassilia faecalis]|uniref:Restriction endonuclease subunit S n=1 Tax=Senegalimassilia faecalis TaxID=2509433 RepID=A0A4Q2K0J9_9ACTN|nr:restriction endonuclease subunit S [Senegalimassilia faecalis]RXZ54929.1 restriction endonuclease subunit S [Senegalimassilia faecalis]